MEKSEIDDLKLETLSGDIRDVLLMTIRDLKRPWSMLTAEEQSDVANRMEMASKELVRKTVRLMTDFEFPRAVVTMGEVKIKGEKGIEAKITCTNIEHNRTVLGEHVGDMVLMLMVDADQFMAERQPVEITPDQPELPNSEAA